MKKTNIMYRKAAAMFWGIWRGYAYICMGVVPGYGLYTTMGSYRSGVSQHDFAENEGFRLSGVFWEGRGHRSRQNFGETQGVSGVMATFS